MEPCLESTWDTRLCCSDWLCLAKTGLWLSDNVLGLSGTVCRRRFPEIRVLLPNPWLI